MKSKKIQIVLSSIDSLLNNIIFHAMSFTGTYDVEQEIEQLQDINKELIQVSLLLDLLKMLIEGNRETSCNESCSPSDWCRGGNCDKKGCFYE
jgi:hypothetical protein